MKKSVVLAVCLGVALALAGAGESEAAKKKYRGKDLTPKQRKEFVLQATKMCKKRFGAPSHIAEIDWYRMKVWCWGN
jgi:hypothetical protein